MWTWTQPGAQDRTWLRVQVCNPTGWPGEPICGEVGPCAEGAAAPAPGEGAECAGSLAGALVRGWGSCSQARRAEPSDCPGVLWLPQPLCYPCFFPRELGADARFSPSCRWILCSTRMWFLQGVEWEGGKAQAFEYRSGSLSWPQDGLLSVPPRAKHFTCPHPLPWPCIPVAGAGTEWACGSVVL